MATFIGFSTQQYNIPTGQAPKAGIDGGVGSITNPIQLSKKFTLVDEQLVLQDFINALNIPQGQKPGNPSFGTSLWSFIFEPNTKNVRDAIEEELFRLATSDPRINLNTITVFPGDNGILIEMELAINPFNDARVLQVFFDQQTSTASLR